MRALSDCRDIAARLSNQRRNHALLLLCDIFGNWETFMGAVMIKCPDTGRDIATGIVADRASFNAMPVFFARVLCPVCRTEHEWFAQEAWVCEAEPAEPVRRRQLS
jgi:hypothetical protein